MAEPELDSLAERLLSIIRTKPGERFPTEKLLQKLTCDYDTLRRAGKLLADWKYRVKRNRKAFTFIKAPDLLTEIEIAHGLKTKSIGRTLVCYRTVKSTNDIASGLAERGAEHGTVVVADQQTKGRGRLGRVWHSPPETGIYVSILLRPSFHPERAPAVSIMTAAALADTFSQYAPGEVQIKWPNDVWIGGKKAAGILTELSADKKSVHHIVIGVGINVNQRVGQFPEEIRPLATSLRRAVKRKVRRVEVLQSFLVNIEREYRNYEKDGLRKSHAKIRRYSALIGHDIGIRTGNALVEGRALDIDIEGRLIMDQNGTAVPITAGEVSVVKRQG
ncbi:biotin--[acetyl-CoA-carboxylase] ligase [candidate division GN15 bacterium]|nr:biotin--[acetyl-CoA-carboxylase] ligase [candidate division GN15 bacterium]